MALRYKSLSLVSFLSFVGFIASAPLLASDMVQVNHTNPTYHCNSSPDWLSPTFFPNDCKTAMARFLTEEIIVHGNMAIEFTAVGNPQHTGLPKQSVPRKYTYGDSSQDT